MDLYTASPSAVYEVLNRRQEQEAAKTFQKIIVAFSLDDDPPTPLANRSRCGDPSKARLGS